MYLGLEYIQKNEESEPERVSKKEELPHYEILDQITTPLRSQGRFAARRNSTEPPNVPRKGTQTTYDTENRVTTAINVPGGTELAINRTRKNVSADTPDETNPENDRPTKNLPIEEASNVMPNTPCETYRPTRTTDNVEAIPMSNSQNKALYLTK